MKNSIISEMTLSYFVLIKVSGNTKVDRVVNQDSKMIQTRFEELKHFALKFNQNMWTFGITKEILGKFC